MSFEEILNRYQWVHDFRVRPAERPISAELFWRYPLPLPPKHFALDAELGLEAWELPSTPDTSLPARHLNYGRALYLQGRYAEARDVWLTARARFGDSYSYHRRGDYFIALAYLRQALAAEQKHHGDLTEDEVRVPFNHLATFLDWAFRRKTHIPDPVLDRQTPRALYMLAILYEKFRRYDAAHATASAGLTHLRDVGSDVLRPQFEILLAENLIRNREYPQAVQVLDRTVRWSRQPQVTAEAMQRVADIYFDLNQYDLANEVYRVAQAIDATQNQVRPLGLLLRGESLFWMGDFAAARAALESASENATQVRVLSPLPTIFAAWTMLRLADTYLAEASAARDPAERQSRIDQARLHYFKVSHTHPDSEPGRIALTRRTCLELPTYGGNNRNHARQSLREIRHQNIALQAQHLAWACEILSLSDEAQEPQMLQELTAFAASYPPPALLPRMLPLLRAARQRELTRYLNAGESARAIAYYETYPDLFADALTPAGARGLFRAYVRQDLAPQAEPLEAAFRTSLPSPASAQDLLTYAVYAAERTAQTPLPAEAATFLEQGTGELRRLASQLKPTAEIQNLVTRLSRSAAAPQHFSWLMQLLSGWSATQLDFLCFNVYTLTSKTLNRADPQTKNALDPLWDHIQKITTTWFPEVLGRSPTCSRNLLSLETRLALLHPDYLKTTLERWLGRAAWQLPEVHLPLQWNLASRSVANGIYPDLGRRLMQQIAAFDQAAHLEARLAAYALAPPRSETEKLWQGRN